MERREDAMILRAILVLVSIHDHVVALRALAGRE